MSVELKLNPTETKTFEEISPFQLFQLPQNSEVWVKVSQTYARTISQHLSSGKKFPPNEPVVLLLPESDEEQ